MARPKAFIEEEPGKLITAEKNNEKQMMTIEGMLYHKHGGGTPNEFPKPEDFGSYEDYLAVLATLGSKIPEDGIEDRGVISAKIADGAVIREKIADDAVTSDKIANEAVTMDKLHPDVRDAIEEAAEIEEDEIKSVMIDDADGTSSQDTTTGSGIKTPHIQNDAVATEKIDDRAVNTDKLADGAVTSNKIADYQVTQKKVREDSISINELKKNKPLTGKLSIPKDSEVTMILESKKEHAFYLISVVIEGWENPEINEAKIYWTRGCKANKLTKKAEHVLVIKNLTHTTITASYKIYSLAES